MEFTVTEGDRRKRKSEETKRKISQSLKGRPLPEETKRKMAEARKGRKLSEEHKKRIGESNKGKTPTLGMHWSKETKAKMSESCRGSKNHNWGKQLSKEHKKNISKSLSGSKSHFWKGGITPITKLIRNSIKYQEWRTDCFIRDKFTCQKCGVQGEYLVVHHKKPFYKLLIEVKKYLPLLGLYEGAMLYNPLWDLDNGITLCENCHERKRKKNGI